MEPRRNIPPELIIAVLLALLLGVANSALASPALVYECGAGGVRTFSDRPCGIDARPRRVETPVGDAAAAATPVVPPQPSRAPRSTASAPAVRPAQSPSPHAPGRPALDCHALQSHIDRIDSRMRLGYRGKLGEKLKAERRGLTDRYAAGRCNTTARRQASSGRSP